MKNFSIVIPVYNPSEELIRLVKKLLTFDIAHIIIVNDGSKKTANPLFGTLKSLDKKIIVLTHRANLGKGAALKTGLDYAHRHNKNELGVVTADADGQHLAENIIAVGKELQKHHHALILGVRNFSKKKIPLRSKLGNLLTIKLFQLITRKKISDTQSGLRGIPRDFIPTLTKIKNNGYEFELAMLLAFLKSNREIREIKIKTLYLDKNKSSHFKPIIDSLKIYRVLFRSLFTK